MGKNKKTILFVIIGIVIVAVCTMLIYLMPKPNEKSYLSVVTTNGTKYKNNKIELKANSTIEVEARIKKENEDTYNYGLFYKMNSGISSHIAIGQTKQNDVDTLKTSGSIKKEEISIPLKISNTSNEKVSIVLDVAVSKLDIKYKESENKINQYYQEKPSNPNLLDGMIPIYYNEAQKTWIKANLNNTNNNWYNYEEKKWANVALVTEQTRGQYQSAKSNTKIKEEDILAYYVWVPRYEYKLFNVSFDSNNVQKIDIKFTLANDSKSNGTKNGEYLTHPAFTFGNTELSGIWVGKFETTGDANIPTIKPNLVSLTNQTVSEQFNTSKKFATKTYINESAISTMDAHMIKNTEWGAVAYLSHSSYGTCNEETCFEIVNNNINTSTNTNGPSITGCASMNKNDKMVISNTCDTSKTKPYNNIEYGVLASTTRSIYGIYDMNGGSWEGVMATMKYKDTNDIITGSNQNMNSGYTGMLYDKDTKKTTTYNGETLPSSEYYDLYEYSEINTDYLKLGDATSETKGWYEDYNQPIINEGSWFLRGGLYNHQNKDGIFAYIRSNGKKSLVRGFRTIIISLNK